MEFFDKDGNSLGEGTEIFNGDGELLGHFFEKAKDSINSATRNIDSGAGSIFWLIFVFLVIAPGWTLLGLLIWLLVKIVKCIVWILLQIIKFLLRCVWWLVRVLPYWIMYREFPEF